VFSNEKSLGVVAVAWLKRFKDHESSAVAEIVNLVLRCAGCAVEVDLHDIEDPDNCASKLTDIQDEYQAVSEILLLDLHHNNLRLSKT